MEIAATATDSVRTEEGPGLTDSSDSSEDREIPVGAPSQVIQGISMCEQKEYPKAIRILRKNLESYGTVNWCRMQFYNYFATFLHCSRLYFLNKELAVRESKACCPSPNPYIDTANEMNELIRQTLKGCRDVAKAALAEKSFNRKELDLLCQMCCSMLIVGDAYELQEEGLVDAALDLAALWVKNSDSDLARTEEAILKAKSLEKASDMLPKALISIENDIHKLNKCVLEQGIARS